MADVEACSLLRKEGGKVGERRERKERDMIEREEERGCVKEIFD